MKFENIGGNAKWSQYSLYDYSDNPQGETIMSIEVNRQDGSWWFVGETNRIMSQKHMKALYEFLETILKAHGNVERETFMVTLNKELDDEVRDGLRDMGIEIIFESKILPNFIGVKADSLLSVQSFSFVSEAREDAIAYLTTKGLEKL